ncbi:hypothetical protein BJV82DRAFT_607798 [Fennellomyces sp. T-0311]|nr:hypothetical protein BJV82DRAFT_607798 [Fennellomyces sp. T-0311]
MVATKPPIHLHYGASVISFYFCFSFRTLHTLSVSQKNCVNIYSDNDIAIYIMLSLFLFPCVQK